MKKPSEIWDSFSEAKGEKRAYVVGVGEGIRSSIEDFRKDEFKKKNSLKEYEKTIYSNGIKKGVKVCSHWVKGIMEGIKMCTEKREVLEVLNYKQIVKSPDIFVKIIDDLYKNPINANTKISFIIYYFLMCAFRFCSTLEPNIRDFIDTFRFLTLLYLMLKINYFKGLRYDDVVKACFVYLLIDGAVTFLQYFGLNYLQLVSIVNYLYTSDAFFKSLDMIRTRRSPGISSYFITITTEIETKIL